MGENYKCYHRRVVGYCDYYDDELMYVILFVRIYIGLAYSLGLCLTLILKNYVKR